MVPSDGKVDDGVRHGEAEKLARRCVRVRLGAAVRRDRSSGGGRRAPVIDGFVVWLHEKFDGVVRGMRNGKGRGMGVASGSGTH